MAIFPAFFYLGNKRQKNIFYDILERKSVFLEKKTKKWHFSKVVNPWFWSKNGHFLHFLFLAIIGQENVCYDILERENAFLGYKNKKFEKTKNWHFFQRG